MQLTLLLVEFTLIFYQLGADTARLSCGGGTANVNVQIGHSNVSYYEKLRELLEA